jgi:LuxR family maltose regulon positive regulatory protein
MKQRILKRKLISAALSKIFAYRLTVVVAALGYGKTTAVKDFLNEVKADYVWLSVDSDEASPQYIWGLFTRQLAKTEPDLGNRLNALGFPIDAPQRDRVIGMIADYAYLTHNVLVIDDYHLAHSPELDRLLERVVRADISGLHLVIISRTRPELNLEELRLKGYCYLAPNDLFELSRREIKAYFGMFGQAVSDETAERVYALSEGWITAVYLMIQRYCEIGALEPGRNIESLIETAIMSRYTPEEVRLLLSLCILDSFTPGQAVFLTGSPAAAAIMQRLSDHNSLIRYDERTGIYQMHHIFSGYLRKRLEERFTASQLKELYRRSGEWYRENGDVPSSLKAFLQAEEYDLILAEFEKPGFSKIIDRDSQLIVRLFEQIPETAKYRRPIAYLIYAEFYLANVDPEGGARLLAEIERHYRDDPQLSLELSKRISGETQLIKSFLFFNDLRKMHEYQLKAYQLLDGRSLIANQDMIMTFGSPHTLYLYYREPGELRWITEYVELVFHYYQEAAGGCGAGFEALTKAEYYLETGDLAQAELYAHKSIYKAETMKQHSVIICADLTLARLYLAQGKFAAAMELLNDLSAAVTEENSPILNSAVDLCNGYIGAILNEPYYIAGWLKSGDMRQSEILYQGMAFNYIVHAKALLLEGNYLKLEALCEAMPGFFAKFNNLLGYLHAAILDAIAKFKLYGMAKARTALGPALEIGRADRIILPFAEYGLYILEILEVLHKEDRDDAYLERLVAETSRYRSNLIIFNGRKTETEPLTEREREILRLMAAGRTNREIAAELYIAEITVKKNVTSIYRKLKVEGRAVAVRKAVELQLT